MSTHSVVGPQSPRRIPGEPGLWVFILADLTLFAAFFVATLVVRSQQPEVFAAGTAELHPALGVANTLLLLTGSLVVARGASAARRGDRAPGRRCFGLAVGCGAAFVACKALEWGLLLHDGRSPAKSDFLQLYFALTGIHLAHVLIGLGGLSWARARLRRPPGATDVQVVEGAASYWHVVDLLWLVLFPLLYLLGTTG